MGEERGEGGEGEGREEGKEREGGEGEGERGEGWEWDEGGRGMGGGRGEILRQGSYLNVLVVTNRLEVVVLHIDMVYLWQECLDILL